MSELPKGWVLSSIGEACLIENGLRKPISLKERANCQGIYPYYGATGIIDYLDNYTHEGEYVLIGEDGANLLSKSKALAFIANGQYWVNNHAHTLRSLAGCPNQYLERYFNSLSLERWVTGSAQPKLTKMNLESIPYPLAPLPEQKRIVEKLDEVLAQVDTIKARLDGIPDLLKRFRQSVLASAVSGKLTEEWRLNFRQLKTDAEILQIVEERKLKVAKRLQTPELHLKSEEYKIPNNWRWVSLDSLSSKIVDGVHHKPEYVEEGVPFMSVKDINGGKILFNNCKYISEETHKDIHSRCNPEKGDLLITKSGTIGRTAIVDTDEIFDLFVSVALIKPASKMVNMEYINIALMHWINSIDVSSRVVGTAIKNLHLRDMRVLAIPFAPVEEQKEIVRLVDQYFAFADTIEAQVKKAQARVGNLTQSILAKAFRGELVPQNEDDEPAEVLLLRIAKARAEAEQLAKAVKKAAKTKKATKKVS